MAVPDFEIVTGEKVSWVHGRIDGVEVTRASFKECVDPFRRELVQVDTPPEHQRNAYARALLRHLANAEPQGPLIDSPVGMNSDEGIATIEAARRAGIEIDEFGCFRDGLGCDCVLSDQSP
jgi:hypothetical protein